MQHITIIYIFIEVHYIFVFVFEIKVHYSVIDILHEVFSVLI